jgi:hypothetical protein
LRCDKLSPKDIQLVACRFLEQLSLLNPSYALGNQKEEENLLHLCSHKLGPKNIQLLTRRLFEQLSLLNPSYALGTKKKKKIYFTCVATNSAQRTSSFLPVDFSNNSVCSIRHMPWAAKRKEKPYFTCVATNSAQ